LANLDVLPHLLRAVCNVRQRREKTSLLPKRVDGHKVIVVPANALQTTNNTTARDLSNLLEGGLFVVIVYNMLRPIRSDELKGARRGGSDGFDAQLAEKGQDEEADGGGAA
jgi:hypothetical protein